MPLDLSDDTSTLVQVMAWCRQATSHYLSQCRTRSMSQNGVTRPQWVLTMTLMMTSLKSARQTLIFRSYHTYAGMCSSYTHIHTHTHAIHAHARAHDEWFNHTMNINTFLSKQLKVIFYSHRRTGPCFDFCCHMRISATRLFVQLISSGVTTTTIPTFSMTGPLWAESIDDLWIPLLKSG